MDWEHYERYRATASLAVISLFCASLLFFRQTSTVAGLRTMLVRVTLPVSRFLSQAQSSKPTTETPVTPEAVPLPDEPVSENVVPTQMDTPERWRRLDILEMENRRLREVLNLKERRWPRALAAHVSGRDPQRWFQEIVIDKGQDDGVAIDDPVVAVLGEREALVGRVVDAGAHVAKVMLIQDSLSAVAAGIQGNKAEDGIIEGTNGHDLMLKYMNRGSAVKIGDHVTTSGLGSAFPEGISIGWVEDISLDPRQLFLQARVRPALSASKLRLVLILIGQKHNEP